MATIETINDNGNGTITKTTKSNGFDKAVGVAGSGLSLANGLAGLLDSIFGFSAKRQLSMQKQLMNMQQDQWLEQQMILQKLQLEQWNRENEYNDPTNYFKRLMNGADANGLSKAAVLGNMPGGSVGTSAQGVKVPGSTSPGSAGAPSLLPIGSSASLSNLRQRAEIENIESQTAVNRANAGLSSEKSITESVHRGYISASTAVQEHTAKLVSEQTLSEPIKRELTSIQTTSVELQNKLDSFTLGYRQKYDYMRADAELSQVYTSINKALAEINHLGYSNQLLLAQIGALKITGALQVEQMRGYKLDNDFMASTFTNRIVQSVESMEQSKLGTNLLNKERQTYFAKFALSSFESLTRSFGNIFDMFDKYNRRSFDENKRSDSTTQYIDKNGELLFTIAKYATQRVP